MTVKELIASLSALDEYTQSFKVGVVLSMQLGQDVRLSLRCHDLKMQDGMDSGNNMIWLKGKR